MRGTDGLLEDNAEEWARGSEGDRGYSHAGFDDRPGYNSCCDVFALLRSATIVYIKISTRELTYNISTSADLGHIDRANDCCYASSITLLAIDFKP